MPTSSRYYTVLSMQEMKLHSILQRFANERSTVLNSKFSGVQVFAEYVRNYVTHKHVTLVPLSLQSLVLSRYSSSLCGFLLPGHPIPHPSTKFARA
jgi:hypothetical protein